MRRRQFVSLTVLGSCAAATAGCGTADDPGGLDADVVLDLADYGDLTTEGGWVELSPSVTDYSESIFVERLANDEFRALSAYCNHEGCNVERSSGAYVCPCHGSRFELSGKLDKGPATAGLRKFDTAYDADANTVTLLA